MIYLNVVGNNETKKKNNNNNNNEKIKTEKKTKKLQNSTRKEDNLHFNVNRDERLSDSRDK